MLFGPIGSLPIGAIPEQSSARVVVGGAGRQTFYDYDETERQYRLAREREKRRREDEEFYILDGH